MKYFIYARKSSEHEDRQMSSIEDQVAEMKRLAAEYRINVVDVVTEAKSAKKPGRPEFNNMLKRMEKGEAEGILCWKLNRLARNPIDGGQISWFLQQRIIKHIQTFGRAYSPEDNVLMMQVEFGMANQYIKDLKVDVERGMKRKIERGWYPAKPPMGYKAVNREIRKLNDPEIIPHPVHYPLVKHLWNLLLTGKYSIAQLKKEGDQIGLQKKNGTCYTVNSYYNLFGSIFYTGSFYWTTSDGIRTRYEGKHQPMITPYEFHKAQEILHGRGDVRQRINTFPYRGIITCGECKGSITAEQKLQAICTNCKWKFSIINTKICPRCRTDVAKMHKPKILDKIYYRCTKRKSTPCTQKYILKPILEETIRAELESISISQEFYEWGVIAIRSLSYIPEETKEIVILKKRKSELQTRLNGLINMRADGELTKEKFETLSNDLSNELAEFEKRLQVHTNLENYIQIEAKECFDFAYHCLSEYKKDDPATNTVLLSTLSSNLTLKDKKLIITTEKVFKHIKECEVEYYAVKASLEPEKSVTKQSVISEYYPYFQTRLSKLRDIRTCLKDKVLKKLEEKKKKGISYSSDDDISFPWQRAA